MSHAKRPLAFLWRWLIVFLPAAVGVLLTLSGVVKSDFKLGGHKIEVAWVLIAIAAVLATAEAGLVARRLRRLSQLEAEREELLKRADGLRTRAEAVEATLLHLIRNELIALEMSAHFYSNERVSLFRRDDDCLTLLARRSPRPLFDESLGRERYALDQGVIGGAWANGAAEETGLPPAGPEGQPARRVWLTAQERRWHVPEAIAARFVMRSQSYAAFRIEAEDRSVGVIVFESTVSASEAQTAGPSPTMRSRSELEPLVKEAGARLASLLEASQSITPERVRALLDTQQGPLSQRRA